MDSFAVMVVTAVTTAVVNIEVRRRALPKHHTHTHTGTDHGHLTPPSPPLNEQVGLCVGIFVSIAVLLQELSEVHTSIMVPVPSHGRYVVRSQSVDPSALESNHVKVIRLTASLFFANQEVGGHAGRQAGRQA